MKTMENMILLIIWSTIDTSCAKLDVLVTIKGSANLKCPTHSASTSMNWFAPGRVPPISKDRTVYTDDNRISITGDPRKGEYNLQISNFQTSDVGIYKCTVSIKNVAYQHEFNLLIGKPPKNLRIENIEKQSTVQKREGEELKLQCVVESGQPKEILRFEKNGNIIKESNSSTVNLTVILNHTDHQSRYTCKAISTALNVSLSQSVNVMVLYAPQVSLGKVGKSLLIKEGNKLTVHCIADSNPEPYNYTWAKISETKRLISTLSTIHIDVIQRKDAGLYACVVTNYIGSGKADTNVVVMYSPKVDIMYTNYTENTKQRCLVCKVKGVPEKYTFYEWEHKSYYGDHIRFMSGNQTGSLTLQTDTIRDSGYQDNGYYKCTASNGIADSHGVVKQSAEVYLVVEGKPIFVSDNVDEVYGTYLGYVFLVVNIFSIPKYTKLEVLDGRSQPITFGSNFRLIEENTSVMDRFLGTEIKVKGYKITVKIERLANDNIDTYTFKAKNDFGQSVHKISVLSAGTPEPPLNVTVAPVANGARVEWTTNFNGGFKQSFFVEYREQGNKRWEKVKTLPTTLNNRMFWTIGNLHEDRSYSFRMFSRNKIGDSNTTREVDFKILKEKNEAILYGVVGSVSLVSLFLILCLIYMIKKRTNKKGKTKKKSVIKDYSQAYNLEERVYNEIDENQLSVSFLTKTAKKKGNDNKDGIRPIQTENRDANTRLSHENLHVKNAYEQF
ncbi:hemicentin-2-like [Mytilus trossulus]|uniref:hemicentin-2-like n=1 Tax=Mytilus trossulus TaxID=6551 RepID=UPI00300673C8